MVDARSPPVPDARVSTRQIRSLHDFARHGRDIEIACACGHTAVLEHRAVIARFSGKGWPIGLGSALRRFRCSRCGAQPERIGPGER